LETEDYLHLRLDDFLARLAAGGRAPGGGSAAALTVAFAASLVAMAARCSRESWEDAAGVAAQALAIADRAAVLARVDATVWQEAADALGRTAAGDPGLRDRDLEQKLERAAARLEEVARRIGSPDLDPAELRALADEALALTGEITERIPRALRAAEPES